MAQDGVRRGGKTFDLWNVQRWNISNDACYKIYNLEGIYNGWNIQRMDEMNYGRDELWKGFITCEIYQRRFGYKG